MVVQACIYLLEKEKIIHICECSTCCSAFYSRFCILCILHYHSSHTNCLTYCIGLVNFVIQNKCQQQNMVVENKGVVQRKQSSVFTVCRESELSCEVCLRSLMSKVYPLLLEQKQPLGIWFGSKLPNSASKYEFQRQRHIGHFTHYYIIMGLNFAKM